MTAEIRNHDLPARSAVSQPTVSPPTFKEIRHNVTEILVQHFNTLATEFFFQILAHPVFKM
jgi:hypothetical protein